MWEESFTRFRLRLFISKGYDAHLCLADPRSAYVEAFIELILKNSLVDTFLVSEVHGGS